MLVAVPRDVWQTTPVVGSVESMTSAFHSMLIDVTVERVAANDSQCTAPISIVNVTDQHQLLLTRRTRRRPHDAEYGPGPVGDLPIAAR